VYASQHKQSLFDINGQVIVNYPGWSPNTPTVHISSGRDRIDAQVGQIEYSIFIESLSQGLMPFLNQFGGLYYGYMNPQYYKNKWQVQWNLVMKILNSIDSDTALDWKNYDHKSVAFYLMMLRIAIAQEWKWPALMYRNPSEPTLRHENGLSRFITTGLCRPEPWNHYRVLFQELPNLTPDDLLSSYTKIDSDEDLHQIFNLEFDRNIVATPMIKLGLIIEQVEKYTRARLRFINYGKFEDELNATAESLLLDFVEWRKLYGQRPKLYVYTNNLNLITDKSSSWEVIYVDKPPGPKIFENFIYNYVNNPVHGHDHVLYHCTSRRIDVADFLPWVGTEHSSYIGPDWSFALVRPAKKYKSILVDVSYIH
jgi:hypothetical protein